MECTEGRIFYIPTFLVLDKYAVLGYNTLLTHGPVMVSTGVLRYDKRGGPDNPDKLSDFKK